jgi:hypothetical protein
MKSLGLIAVLAAAFMAAPGAFAQSAAPAAGSQTVTCNDGTTQTVTTTKGACHGHKGINKSASSSSGSSSAGASNSMSSGAAAPAAAAPAAASKSDASSNAMKSAPAATPAAGGGPGQVWVNTSSKTKAYHCQGSKWYGTTKQGKYMSTSDAQAAGYHAAKGEKCS